MAVTMVISTIRETKEEGSQRRRHSTRFLFLPVFDQREGIKSTRHFNAYYYYYCMLDDIALVLSFSPDELIISP